MDDEKGKRSSISSSASSSSSPPSSVEEIMDVRRGPWTVEEDMKLINYIAAHAEGRWNSLARSAGLKRTGKSCRLRWLNYLRPDVRRGNITLQEQLLILQLHSRWGNRWSKIAEQLPGRTDNEIKNYWRTRVQKHAKQLRCDVNSKQFKDTVRYLWMPRLLERIHASAADDTNLQSSTTVHSAIIAPEISSSTAAAAGSSSSDSSAAQTHNYQTSTTTHVPVNASIISNTDNYDDDDQYNLQFAAAAGQQAIGDYSGDSFIPPTSFITNNTGPLDFYGRSLLDDHQNASWTTNDVSDASIISNHQLGLCYTNDDFWSTSLLHQQYLNY